TLPWQDEVLVPSIGVFGGPELAGAAEGQLGRSQGYVAGRAGPRTGALALRPGGRFPPGPSVPPPPSPACSRRVLDPDDAALLSAQLPALPGAEDEHAPITLDLGQPPVVRARADGQSQLTEVVLRRSRVAGPRLRLCFNRRYLQRAL